MFKRFEGYHPDIDEAAPGMIVDGENIIPSPAGYRSAYAPVNSTSPALTATAVDAATLIDLAGTPMVYAGTATQLYKEDGSSWSAVSRVGDYTACTSWDFAQYGNSTYATNDVAIIQKSTGADFADLSGSPVAKIIAVAQNQVMVFNTNEGTFGDSPNRWWCSALGNPDDWSPSISTQAASGQLVDTPGAIVAGLNLGERMVAYKENSMYLGSYVGPPSIWAWPLITDQIGCVGKNAVVNVKNAHFFMGPDDFYVFSGTYPQGIGGTFREHFFQREVNKDFLSKTIAAYDQVNGLVYFFYVSADSSGGIDRHVVYHIATQKWSPPTNLDIQTATQYTKSSLTYDTLGDAYATYDDLPSISYDSLFWVATNDSVGIINTSNRLQTLSEPASSMSVTTWSIGSEEGYSFFDRVRPRFQKYPTSGTLVNSYQEDLGGAWVSSTDTITLNNGKFDFERESRFHKVRMDFVGDTEITGIDMSIKGAGSE